MKLPLSLVAAALLLVMVQACVPGLKGSKNQQDVRDPKAQNAPDQSNPMNPANPAQEFSDAQGGKQPRPLAEKTAESSLDFQLKDEINRSGLEFAKNLPNVKHVKTCFSQIYGGWNLFVYVQRGKKIAFHQYVWNKEFQQWELSYHQRDLPEKQLEYHLKGEIGDEKCFILK
jgi:hypothetical protein